MGTGADAHADAVEDADAHADEDTDVEVSVSENESEILDGVSAGEDEMESTDHDRAFSVTKAIRNPVRPDDYPRHTYMRH